MAGISTVTLNRRSVLLAGMAAAMVSGPAGRALAAAAAKTVRLTAAPGRIALVGAPHPETAVWCYDGQVPGPAIRIRQGDRLQVVMRNDLPQETTVHWHGVRVPHAMDGVPHVSQEPIRPGGSFTYAFDCVDAGTFWYHPHLGSAEQVGRGLAGALIVEEREPLAVDRDLVWVLGDWRLQRDASISDDFGHWHDLSHAGRLGNTVTVNGRVTDEIPLRAGERIRLRLINAAVARVFALDFDGHEPLVVALDGQPVAPHAPAQGRVMLGPGMRVDLVLDAAGKPGERWSVVDRFNARRNYRLVDLAYAGEKPLRDHPLDAPVALPPNPVPEPDLGAAEHHAVVLEGGMMGAMAGALVRGEPLDLRGMMRNGLAWAVNGVAATGHAHDPFLTLRRGQSCRLTLHNQTAWWHPMHLHGHSFRVIARNGEATRHKEWQDSVLMAPREQVEIAFVADNPGDWMFHCHVLDHQAGGMMGLIRVA